MFAKSWKLALVLVGILGIAYAAFGQQFQYTAMPDGSQRLTAIDGIPVIGGGCTGMPHYGCTGAPAMGCMGTTMFRSYGCTGGVAAGGCYGSAPAYGCMGSRAPAYGCSGGVMMQQYNYYQAPSYGCQGGSTGARPARVFRQRTVIRR